MGNQSTFERCLRKINLNPLPHTTILQQTTFETYWQKREKSRNESVIIKMSWSNFFFCHNVFKSRLLQMSQNASPRGKELTLLLHVWKKTNGNDPNGVSWKPPMTNWRTVHKLTCIYTVRTCFTGGFRRARSFNIVFPYTWCHGSAGLFGLYWFNSQSRRSCYSALGRGTFPSLVLVCLPRDSK